MGARQQSMGVVYLCRHGQTRLNAGGLVRGLLDEPLDEVGRAQAAALGVRFAEIKLSAVVSSPLGRAVETAQAVAAAQAAAPKVETLQALLDRDWGPWAGQDQAKVVETYGSLDLAPDVEPHEEFRQRILGVWQDLGQRSLDGPVLAVAHDAVNRMILHSVGRLALDADQIPQRTGCWNQVDYLGDDRWHLAAVDQLP